MWLRLSLHSGKMCPTRFKIRCGQHPPCKCLALCRLYHSFDFLAAGHIGLKNHASRAARFHLIEYLLRRGLVLMIIHHHGGAALREANRCRRANAPACAGHQSGLPTQCFAV